MVQKLLRLGGKVFRVQKESQLGKIFRFPKKGRQKIMSCLGIKGVANLGSGPGGRDTLATPLCRRKDIIIKIG